MKEYTVEVVVHMQVLVKVEAESEAQAHNQAARECRDHLNVTSIHDIVDLTIADTYINE